MNPHKIIWIVNMILSYVFLLLAFWNMHKARKIREKANSILLESEKVLGKAEMYTTLVKSHD